MPIQIGQKPQSPFSDPMGLLGDCHRRIERFLQILLTVTEEAKGGPLSPDRRDALASALRYFREAAPKHTEDEERSLFPRMRKTPKAEVRAAMAFLQKLEEEHAEADRGQAEVEDLGRRWLADGSLPPEENKRLTQRLRKLREAYNRHIALEESEVFPLAGKFLSPAELAEIGREMAARRGIDPGAAAPSDRAPVY